ncbi:MOSC domain-containing protein [Dietzia psychralcaliphila]|uniref:Sulfurase n=1 Tax=Dietzia psychralcaliphila TaxID=139021 RepID=A0AAD0NR91_9ACTN|nr:MOSC domain-containing protein [Dietzia psychralcaliphila]AWH95893.1 sulfurase [Dietzia psychralcaliphila]PTM85712.1 MOSC domain-containing protein YiiM [Dietzia psychralcaliphila]
MPAPSSPASGESVPESFTVQAVCVVEQLLTVPGRVGVTAIDKRPVEGPVQVREYGLHGDVQADREHHGGVWKAVYLLSDSDVEPWEPEFGGPIPPGYFGENLRVTGVDTSQLQIGTVLEVGEGTGRRAPLRLEVTTPRIPCQTFGDRVGKPRWVRRFTEAGRPGAYARVLHPGSVGAGDEIRVVTAPSHGVTIGRVFAGVDDDEVGRLLAEYSLTDLAPSLVRKLDPATDVRPADAD